MPSRKRSQRRKRRKSTRLSRNKYGKKVPVVKSKQMKSRCKSVKNWCGAVAAARKELKIKGFKPIKKGSAFYKRAKEIYNKAKGTKGGRSCSPRRRKRRCSPKRRRRRCSPKRRRRRCSPKRRRRRCSPRRKNKPPDWLSYAVRNHPSNKPKRPKITWPTCGGSVRRPKLVKSRRRKSRYKSNRKRNLFSKVSARDVRSIQRGIKRKKISRK